MEPLETQTPLTPVTPEKVKDESPSYNTHTLGGRRPGAGRPFGSMNKKTKEQKIIDEEFRGRILNSIHDLLTAQFSLAKGVSHLFRIEHHKGLPDEHVLVTDPEEIKQVLDECEGNGTFDDHYYYITTKSPDNKALDSLFDRVFGRAPQKIDARLSGELNVITGMKIVKDTGVTPGPESVSNTDDVGSTPTTPADEGN